MSKKREWFKWKHRAGTRGTIRRTSRRVGNGFEVMGACVALLDHAYGSSHWTENPEGVFKTTIEDLAADYHAPEARVRELLGALAATGWLQVGGDPAAVDGDEDIHCRVIRYLAFNDPQGSSSDRQAATRDNKIVEEKALAFRFLLASDVEPVEIAELAHLQGSVTTRHNSDGKCTEEKRREEKREEHTSPSAEPKDDIPRMLFDHWITATNRNANQNRLTAGRRAHVNGRLRDGYSLAQLKAAIDGIAASPWHAGSNPQSKRYDTFDFIMRSGENVEKGMESGAGAAGMQPDHAALIASLPTLGGAA